MASLEKIMAWLPKFTHRVLPSIGNLTERKKIIMKLNRTKKEKEAENEKEKIKYNMPG